VMWTEPSQDSATGVLVEELEAIQPAQVPLTVPQTWCGREPGSDGP
jgi:hypothetical protein